MPFDNPRDSRRKDAEALVVAANNAADTFIAKLFTLPPPAREAVLQRAMAEVLERIFPPNDPPKLPPS
ncbi:MAG: hypothetical protein WAV50_00685 [Minisyncoccia bacterium]